MSVDNDDCELVGCRRPAEQWQDLSVFAELERESLNGRSWKSKESAIARARSKRPYFIKSSVSIFLSFKNAWRPKRRCIFFASGACKVLDGAEPKTYVESSSCFYAGCASVLQEFISKKLRNQKFWIQSSNRLAHCDPAVWRSLKLKHSFSYAVFIRGYVSKISDPNEVPFFVPNNPLQTE